MPRAVPGLIDAGGDGGLLRRGLVKAAEDAILPTVRRLIDESVGRIAVRDATAAAPTQAVGIRRALMFDPAAGHIYDDPDNGQVVIPLASGGGAFVGAKAHNTTGVILASGSVNVPIPLDVEDFDTSAMHDPATNAHRFTVPADGTYHCVAGAALINYFANPTHDPFFFELGMRTSAGFVYYHAELAMTLAQAQAGIWGSITIADYFQLSAGDTIDLVGSHNAGVNMVTDTQYWNWARMSVVKVG